MSRWFLQGNGSIRRRIKLSRGGREDVKGRPTDSVPQLAECSHGKREALASSPGRAKIPPLHILRQS
ncbi:MAG: hypothetical protein AB2693_33335 [Candidatus Thiodiazotropha sp.]